MTSPGTPGSPHPRRRPGSGMVYKSEDSPVVTGDRWKTVKKAAIIITVACCAPGTILAACKELTKKDAPKNDGPAYVGSAPPNAAPSTDGTSLDGNAACAILPAGDISRILGGAQVTDSKGESLVPGSVDKCTRTVAGSGTLVVKFNCLTKDTGGQPAAQKEWKTGYAGGPITRAHGAQRATDPSSPSQAGFLYHGCLVTIGLSDPTARQHLDTIVEAAVNTGDYTPSPLYPSGNVPLPSASATSGVPSPSAS